MATKDGVGISEMFRSSPVQSAMVSVVPLLLAAGQLANGYFNGMSMLVSILFAAVLVPFAGILTQYQHAQFRRRYVERDL